jgi:hypothetical protein
MRDDAQIVVLCLEWDFVSTITSRQSNIMQKSIPKKSAKVNDHVHVKILFCLQYVKKLLHKYNHSTLQLSILGPFRRIDLQFIIENNKDV